jgi:hypothetical protein
MLLDAIMIYRGLVEFDAEARTIRQAHLARAIHLRQILE